MKCKNSIVFEDLILWIVSIMSYFSSGILIYVLMKNDLSTILDFANFNCIFCSATLQCYIIVRSYRILLLIVLRFFPRVKICLKMRSTEPAFYILRSVAVFFHMSFLINHCCMRFYIFLQIAWLDLFILFLSKRSLSNILV